MKRLIIALIAVLFLLPGAAQKRKGFEITNPRKKAKTELDVVLPDSSTHCTPWKPSFQAMEQVKISPSVSMTSIVLVTPITLPSHITVLKNNTLRLRRVSISNGQAWNRSPFPDAYLDARTLMMPMRRK